MRWTLALTALFLLHLLPFATRPSLIGGDEPHYALMAHSIATDWDVDLRDDYEEVASGSAAAGRKRAGQSLDPHLRQVGDTVVFSHPLGLPLLAAPVIALTSFISPQMPPDVPLALLTLVVTFAGLLAGWHALGVLIGDRHKAALLVFGGYFSSPLWYYSRTFFTEPYIWAWCALAIFSVVAGRLTLAAVFLFLALAMKETALLLVAPFILACLGCIGLRKTALLAVGPALFGVLFVLKNLVLTGEALSTFQPFHVGHPLRGAAGLLADPSRGILWFAPLLAAGSIGWFFRHATDSRRWIHYAALLAFFGYFLVSAAWVDWRGGTGYGPRLLVPALLALFVPLGQILFRYRALDAAFALLFLVGFVVNWCAALDPVAAFWDRSVADLLTDIPKLTSGALVGGIILFYALRMVPKHHIGDHRLRPASD